MADINNGKLDQILTKLNDHDKRFDSHDENFRKIAGKLLEHDDRIGKIDGNIDLKFDKVLTGLDKVVKELEKIRGDQILAIGKDKTQDQRLDKLELLAGVK